jgi:pimeloyl-ACP methyl ester carboxylesterase
MEVPAIMQHDWEAALRFGLQRVSSTVPSKDIDVQFAFYGDIWRPDLRQPLPVIEPEPPKTEGIRFPGGSDISLWVDEHLGIGDALIDHMLKDVDDYFSEPELRDLTNRRLTSAIQSELPDGEKVIVVGFSMGSLVAYDTLRADPKLPVAAMLTIGSPLAMPSFYRRVEASAPKPGGPRTPFSDPARDVGERLDQR